MKDAGPSRPSPRLSPSPALHSVSNGVPDSVRDWLKDFKILRPTDLPVYAAAVAKDARLPDAIAACVRSWAGVGNGAMPDASLLSSICHQLFQFYRQAFPDDPSSHPSFPLRLFSLQFLPVLIETYLLSLASSSFSSLRDVSALETFLLGVYNLDVVRPDGRPKVTSFAVPSLARPSVFHEPANLIGNLALTESELNRLDRPGAGSKVLAYGPFPPASGFNARNREVVLSHLLHMYNSVAAEMPTSSRLDFCRMTIGVCSAGMLVGGCVGRDGDDTLGGAASSASSSVPTSPPLQPSHRSPPTHPPPLTRRGVSFLHPSTSASSLSSSSSPSSSAPLRRVAVSPRLLLEMTLGVYPALYSPSTAATAAAAVEALGRRCGFELFPETMLLVNAIKNATKDSCFDAPQSEAAPMGLSAEETLSPVPAATPVVAGSRLARSKITNASFSDGSFDASRTKQLPSDPRVEEEDEEEEEEEVPVTEVAGDVSIDVTQAAEQLQLTVNNEKTSKGHGFKVPKGTTLKSALRKTGERAMAQMRDHRASIAATSSPASSSATDEGKLKTPHDSAVDLDEIGGGGGGEIGRSLDNPSTHLSSLHPRLSVTAATSADDRHPLHDERHLHREDRHLLHEDRHLHREDRVLQHEDRHGDERHRLTATPFLGDGEIDMMTLATARKISMVGGGSVDFGGGRLA